MVRTKNHAQKHTPLKRHWVSATGRLHTQQSTANTHTKGPLENAHEKGHKRHQNPQTQHTSNGPALSQPQGQRHSPVPSRKRRTVRHRAPDGPTNVGQQGPSTAKQALTQTQASDGPACDAGRSGVRRMVQRITPDSPACTKTQGQARDNLLGKPNPTKLHQMNPNLPQTLKTPNRVC